MKTKLVGLLFGILGIFVVGVVYAVFTITTSNNDFAIGGGENDTWTLTGTITATPSSATYSGTITGEIESTLFGDFKLDGSGGNQLLLENNGSTDCASGLTYDITGKTESDEFGIMIPLNSHYCPEDGYIYLELSSQLIGSKIIESTSTTPVTFSEGSIDATGVSSIQGTGVTDIRIDENSFKAIVNREIKSKIQQVTKSLIAENDKSSGYIAGVACSSGCRVSDFNNTSTNDKYYYFDYSGETGTDNGYGNEGSIVSISNNSSFESTSPTGYQVGVSGVNVMIVKGANVYINADIYNNNDSSDLLVIVAQRDESNKKNGGNIYIDPDVTNIDAVLIAEGSLLSYRSGGIITDSNSLRRQLLVYGSILSSNSVNQDTVPYGADQYEKLSGNIMTNSIYDLVNLRKFRTKVAPLEITGENCWVSSSTETYLVGMRWDSLAAAEYVWAGKSKCYNKNIDSGSGLDGEPTANLRTSSSDDSFIVEYNPGIKLIKPFILQK